MTVPLWLIEFVCHSLAAFIWSGVGYRSYELKYTKEPLTGILAVIAIILNAIGAQL